MKFILIGQTIINLAILLIINYDLAIINRSLENINSNLYTMYKKIKEIKEEIRK